ncbi:MAG: hypothetical protein DRP35_01385 [Candidatus Zixiibacteriota bacterium]|nr:MAG: hypothetical protein DRP35_01385 [candidate division Zixibacteria bacterium]
MGHMQIRDKNQKESVDIPSCSDERVSIAEYEQAELTLQFAQFAMEHFSNAIIWTRDNGSINFVNDAACSLLGYVRPDLVTKTIFDIVPDFSKTTWVDNFQAIRKNLSRVQKLTLVTSDNQKIRVTMASHYLALRGKEYNCFFVNDMPDELSTKENEQKFKENLEHQVALQTTLLREEIDGREKIESVLLDEAERIQNILDNVGQGFLTFGQNMKIDLQYSQECRIMFEGEIWDRSFPELIFPDDEAQRTFLKSVLNDIFVETDKDRQEVFFSLLPSEVSLSDNKYIEIKFRRIIGACHGEMKLMAILTDVTKTRRLRDQVGEERRNLKMVVGAVVQYKELVESLSDYEDFCTIHFGQILQGPGSADEKLYEIYRRIHTFKGTFSQLELTHLVSKLDSMETHLSKLQKDSEHTDIATIEKLFDESNMRTWPDKEIKILRATLGQSYFDSEPALDIKSSQINEIEEEMTQLLSPSELRQLLPKIKKLRYRSIKELLRSYPEYVERLSDRLQKPTKPMIIEGDDISVNPELYGNFCKALVHVFRNSVDHGIESIEKRQERGKNESAQIKCCIKVNDGTLILEISDDGAGIDVQLVKQKAIAKGICDLDTAKKMNDTELLKLIFEDNLSTRETPTEYSGRGIGLSAINEELNRLSGQVEVKTKIGEGTTFIFSVPVNEAFEVPKFSIELTMDTIIDRAKSYMTEEMDLTIDTELSKSKMKTELLELDGVISLISLKGALSAVFAMGFDNDLALHLVRKFAIGELTESEEKEYLGDTMSEIANIVTGSTLNVLPKTNNMITIGTPTTCTTEGASHLSFAGPEMWTAVIKTNQGKFSVSLLMSEGN